MNTHHEAMDDTADFGAELNTREGYHRVPKGCDYQGRWPQAAEAATEVGADDDGHIGCARPLLAYIAVGLVALCAVIGSALA